MTRALHNTIRTLAELNDARILTPVLEPTTPPFGYDSPRTIVGEGEEMPSFNLNNGYCLGCREGLANQLAHYDGCLRDAINEEFP
jgi:hypothetical protein